MKLTTETIYILRCYEGERHFELGYYTSLADAEADKEVYLKIDKKEGKKCYYHINKDTLYRRIA